MGRSALVSAYKSAINKEVVSEKRFQKELSAAKSVFANGKKELEKIIDRFEKETEVDNLGKIVLYFHPESCRCKFCKGTVESYFENIKLSPLEYTMWATSENDKYRKVRKEREIPANPPRADLLIDNRDALRGGTRIGIFDITVVKNNKLLLIGDPSIQDIERQKALLRLGINFISSVINTVVKSFSTETLSTSSRIYNCGWQTHNYSKTLFFSPKRGIKF